MKANYNGLYDFMINNEGRSLEEFTLKQIGDASGLDHPEKVKNGINYLIKKRYISLGEGLIIKTHDGYSHENFYANVNTFIEDYKKLRKIISEIKSLTK